MSEQTATEWTPDEKLIIRASQELDLMINTSGYSPFECLRRVMLPVLEKVRADVKATCPDIPSAEDSPTAKLHNALEEIRDTATTSLKPDVYPTEESWQRSRLQSIEAKARKALR